MHKTILAAFAAVGLVVTAHAQPPESWVYAGMQGGAMGWEASSIRKNEATGTASALRFFYFATPEEGEKGDFSWAFQDIEFDCAANTFRLMEGAFFNKARRGRSDQLGSEDSLPVRDNTPEYVLKRVVCDDATLSGSLAASSMADAMDGAETLVQRRVEAALGERPRG
jgi:hypothetical protein